MDTNYRTGIDYIVLCQNEVFGGGKTMSVSWQKMVSQTDFSSSLCLKSPPHCCKQGSQIVAQPTLSGEQTRLLRFLLVGGSFSLGYALVTAFLIGKMGAPPFATSVLIYALCIPAAYLIQKKFTFGKDRTNRASFLIYVSTQVVGLGLVALVTTRFVTYIYLYDTALFLVTAGIAAVLSYSINRIFAFKTP